jgi:predicted nucleotidyltransferase
MEHELPAPAGGKRTSWRGRLLFGSVAAGTHRPDTDVDVITWLTANNPAWGA